MMALLTQSAKGTSLQKFKGWAFTPSSQGKPHLVIFGVKKKPIVSIEKIGYLLLELAD